MNDQSTGATSRVISVEAFASKFGLQKNDQKTAETGFLFSGRNPFLTRDMGEVFGVRADLSAKDLSNRIDYTPAECIALYFGDTIVGTSTDKPDPVEGEPSSDPAVKYAVEEIATYFGLERREVEGGHFYFGAINPFTERNCAGFRLYPDFKAFEEYGYGGGFVNEWTPDQVIKLYERRRFDRLGEGGELASELDRGGMADPADPINYVNGDPAQGRGLYHEGGAQPGKRRLFTDGEIVGPSSMPDGATVPPFEAVLPSILRVMIRESRSAVVEGMVTPLLARIKYHIEYGDFPEFFNGPRNPSQLAQLFFRLAPSFRRSENIDMQARRTEAGNVWVIRNAESPRLPAELAAMPGVPWSQNPAIGEEIQEARDGVDVMNDPRRFVSRFIIETVAQKWDQRMFEKWFEAIQEIEGPTPDPGFTTAPTFADPIEVADLAAILGLKKEEVIRHGHTVGHYWHGRSPFFMVPRGEGFELYPDGSALDLYSNKSYSILQMAWLLRRLYITLPNLQNGSYYDQKLIESCRQEPAGDVASDPDQLNYAHPGAYERFLMGDENADRLMKEEHFKRGQEDERARWVNILPGIIESVTRGLVTGIKKGRDTSQGGSPS